MIRDILEAAGYKTGLLGTIDYEIGEEKKRAERTTPEAIEDVYKRQVLGSSVAGSGTQC